MARYLFDCETDGLLDKLTTIHCLVLRDIDTDTVFSFSSNRGDIKVGVRMLMDADMIVGHNIIKFDIPAIAKVYPWFNPQGVVRDTLIISRLVWSDLKERDLKKRGKPTTTLPPGKIGSHALEAWGYRLGQMKGDYASERKERAKGLGIPKEEIDDFVWGSWNPEMQAYCEQDVEVTKWLWDRIIEAAPAEEAVELEHYVAQVMWAVEQRGIGFDTDAAGKLTSDLMQRRAEIEQELQSVFPPWWKNLGEVVPKRTVTPRKDLTKAGTWAGAPYTKIELEVFNPGSRDHIANRLKRLRNWNPCQFTDSGKPKIDEEVLTGLDYPEAALLTEYLTIQKRLGQIAEGANGWLRLVTKEGRIHAGYTTGGAVTGRATHSRPNIGQVPSVATDKDGNILWGYAGGWGAECRALFIPDAGKVLIGCDLSGLELRMLGHYMAKWDNGAYIKVLLEGDIHTVNQEAAGLPTRAMAKTFIYAFLYGAGDMKIGSIVGKGRAAGASLRKRFLSRLKALKNLIERVKKKSGKSGYLIGLDGRKLRIRSKHAALNTLLQAAGAVLAKRWIYEFVELLKENGLHNRAHIVAWVHDELQIECFPEDAELVGQLCEQAAVKAGEHFKLRVPTPAEAKVGKNWKETH